MAASGAGDLDVIGFLLKKGADVDAQDRNGSTALMFAAGFKKPNAMELLLKNGANRDLKDNQGRTGRSTPKTDFPGNTFL